MSTEFSLIKMHKTYFSIANEYGNLVHQHSSLPGAHNTPAADSENDVLSHVKGKYGEIAFFRWVMKERMLPSHTPFRNDYSKKVEDDDFIVNGLRIEVKAKRRGSSSPFPPPAHYKVNLGKSGLEDVVYVFVEIDPEGEFEAGPECLLLGWANSLRIQEIGKQTTPGTHSDNGNFSFKRYDWDIVINKLFEPQTLSSLLRLSCDAHSPEPLKKEEELSL